MRCWQANGNRYTAFGCAGQGTVATAVSPPSPASSPTTPRCFRLSLRQLGGVQSRLVLSIAIAIIVISFSCFVLWAIAHDILIEWPYRDPLPAITLLLAHVQIG